MISVVIFSKYTEMVSQSIWPARAKQMQMATNLQSFGTILNNHLNLN